jgi:hypothetical protein
MAKGPHPPTGSWQNFGGEVEFDNFSLGMGATGARGTGRMAGMALATGWGAGVIALFLVNRHYDLAYLPTWVPALVHELTLRSPVAIAGLGHSVGGVIAAALIVVAWWGLGSFVLAFVIPSRELGSRALDWGVRALLGAGAWSTVWFFLGLIHLYRTPLAVSAVGAGLVLAVRAWPRQEALASPAGGRRPRIATALLVLLLGLALVAALAPPTANDALLYHLAMPKAYVGSGGLVEVKYSMASYFALGVEMHAVWAMLVGRLVGPRVAEAAAGATLFAFAVLAVLVTYGWARRRHLDRVWSTLAALTFAAVPSVYFVVAGQGVDVAVAAYAALALLAAGRWWTTLDHAWLRLLAAAVGSALAAKLTAVGLIAPLMVAVLLRGLAIERAPRAGGPTAGVTILKGLSALGVGVALASPWYIRTWAWTGSPVFPFYSTLWPGHAPGWDEGRARLLDSLIQLYGRSASVLDYVLSPFYVSILAQPELPQGYEGVLGPAFLLGAPLLVWAFRRGVLDVELRLATLVAGAMFVLWLFGSQVIRYLLAAMPALAVAMAAAAASAAATWGRSARRCLGGLLLGAAVANALVVVAWFAELNPLPVVLGGEARAQFLGRRLDYYPYYQRINQDLPPTARVWLIGTRRDTYHLERPYFADYLFGTYTVAQWVRETRDGAELRARAREHGITHVLIRHDALFSYASSAIVNDARPPAVNRARLERLRVFLFQGTRVLQGGPKFLLVELDRADS